MQTNIRQHLMLLGQPKLLMDLKRVYGVMHKRQIMIEAHARPMHVQEIVFYKHI
jgi:hypothetical protein